ncbi:MAG: pilus assembly protein [Deltaproteobacteria bacterium]|nr:pilus assembly protein [Deltaproteobacteria bacterium]
MIIKDQNGGSLIEFAIVLPLLAILIFGIIEFSILFYNKAMVTNAAREGARAGIVFAPVRPSEAELETIINNYAEAHLINFDQSQLLIKTFQHTDSDNTVRDVDDAITADVISSGEPLTVTLNYTYQFLVLPNVLELVKGSFTNTQLISAVSVMRYE